MPYKIVKGLTVAYGKGHLSGSKVLGLQDERERRTEFRE